MPRIKKIIILIEQNYDRRNYERFGIELLAGNGLEPEIWDCTLFFQKKSYQPSSQGSWAKCGRYRLFRSRKEVLIAFAGVDTESFVVSLISYNLNTYFIYRQISKKKIKYAIFMANSASYWAIRNEDKKTSVAYKLKDMPLYILSLARALNFFFLRIPPLRIGIRTADFILAGGEKSLVPSYLAGPETEILWMHALDFDIFLQKRKDTQKPSAERVAVFLDEYVPFHPDYGSSGIKPYSSPEEYYPVLSKFFDKLEKIYGFKVVIAAHPRSDYDSHPDYFQGRAVVKARTAELIRDSALAVSHSSLSVNLCVLFEKPVVFITTEALDRTIQGRHIRAMADSLGKGVINISKDYEIDLLKELTINQEMYSSYRKKYIKRQDSQELPFWQILVDHIKTLSND